MAEHDFVAVAEDYAFACALRDGDDGTVPEDGSAVGTAVIEETVQSFLGVELKMRVRPRDGWIGSWPVIAKGHVVLTSEPLIGVNDFGESPEVDALFLKAQLLLLSGSGGDGAADLHHFIRGLESGSGSIMHIEAAGRHIGWQLRHQFDPYGKLGGSSTR